MDQEGKIKAMRVIDNQMIAKWIQMKGQILDGIISKMQLDLGRADLYSRYYGRRGDETMIVNMDNGMAVNFKLRGRKTNG